MGGGFSVANATLTRFFTLHFLLPFVLAALRAVHLLFLHQTGSSNPLGVSRNLDKSPFHPYFSIKDVFGFVLFISLRYFTLDSKQVGRCPCAGAICSYPNCYTFLRENTIKKPHLLTIIKIILLSVR